MLRLLGRLFGGGAGPRCAEGLDDADIEGIRASLAEYLAEPAERRWNVNPRELAAGEKLLAQDERRLIATLELILRLARDAAGSGRSGEWWERHHRREKLVSDICRRALPFTESDARALLEDLAHLQSGNDWPQFPALAKSLARAAQRGGWLALLQSDLKRLREAVAASLQSEYADARKYLEELDRIIEQAEGKALAPFRIEKDLWGERARAALAAMEHEAQRSWLQVLAYCGTARGAAPSGKWLKAGGEAIELYGRDAFAAQAATWLGLLDAPAPGRDASGSELTHYMVSEKNGDALRGLVWLLIHTPTEATAAALRDAAVATYRKVPNRGARSVKVANACLHALKNFPGLAGARELAMLRARIKQPSAAAVIARALAECAAREGTTAEEIEELAAPDHGFADGRRYIAFGEFSAALEIDGSSVVLRWLDAEGAARKTEPAAIKRDFPAERKALKRLADEVEKALAAARDRLERLPLAGREWPVDVWRTRYADHPIVGTLARRLIWRFRDARGEKAALFSEGQWLDENGAPVSIEGTTVLPWHPVFTDADSVRRWRQAIAARGVTQPFKQAHREIYLLTDAERNTGTYSNRFAAHVLRQHQFASLCAARGWRYALQGAYDTPDETPSLALPQWNLRAEFWVERPLGDEDNTSGAGVYLHVLTDQVRFLPLDQEAPAPYAPRDTRSLPLEDIPPIVLSEVMRDVDLFVGVTSVGNDPTWNDGGPNGHHREYWTGYAFGELAPSAETRREIIAELLPRLALRERARIDGRFLVVRGDLRTYKIHLGSGNILMEPNDQYLCIVPDRSSRAPVLKLPFEGDGALAVILSKAFLLARDKEIKDPTIVRQITAWRA